MLINAKEFLEKGRQHGYSKEFFKNTMLTLTDTVPFDILIAEKQSLYVISDCHFRYLRYQSLNPGFLPYLFEPRDEDNFEYYVEAGELIKVFSN